MSGWRTAVAPDPEARCDDMGHYVMVGVCVRCGLEISDLTNGDLA